MEIVSILEVTVENLSILWPSITAALEKASFVAVDLELSGLGDREKLSSKDLEERYSGLRAAAQTRAVVSVGLSCFRQLGQDQQYLVQTFNLLALCEDEYETEPSAITFLSQHGFDFSRQKTKGIPYRKPSSGPEQKSVASILADVSLSALMLRLLTSPRPVILHNGLVDLTFLYGHFYASLPRKLNTFTADLSEILIGGVCDTKFIAAYLASMPTTFLQFVFRKRLRLHRGKARGTPHHLSIIQPKYKAGDQFVTTVSLFPSYDREAVLCSFYMEHGWCREGGDCVLSHSVDHALELEDVKESLQREWQKEREEKKRQRGRVRKRGRTVSSDTPPEALLKKAKASELGSTSLADTTEASPNLNIDSKLNSSASSDLKTANSRITHPLTCDTVSKSADGVCSGGTKNYNTPATSGGSSDCHRAGFDAYMTGYAYVSLVHDVLVSSAVRDAQTDQLQQIDPNEQAGLRSKASCREEVMNKLFLGGKQVPLRLLKGNFTKTSRQHDLVQEQLQSARKEGLL